MKQLRDAKAAFQAEDTLSSLFSTPFSCLCNLHRSLSPYCPPLPALEIKKMKSNLQEVRDQRGPKGERCSRAMG